MTTQETNGSAKERHEHAKIGETEENDPIITL